MGQRERESHSVVSLSIFVPINSLPDVVQCMCTIVKFV